MSRTSNIQLSVGLTICLMFLSLSANATEFGCMLRPIKTVDIRTPVVGRLSTVNVERGSHVKKGQVIARLDDSVEQAATNSAKYRSTTKAQIVSAQNKVAAAQQRVDRMNILYAADFMSAQALDDTVHELKTAQAELDAARESKAIAEYDYKSSLSELDRKTIISPINGIVTARYLDEGSIVSPTDGNNPIMTLAQTDKLKVQIIAPVKYFNNYRKGSRITIVPEAPFNKPINATVSIKDSAIDAASGTFSMIAYVNNSRNKLPSGILCNVK